MEVGEKAELINWNQRKALQSVISAKDEVIQMQADDIQHLREELTKLSKKLKATARRATRRRKVEPEEEEEEEEEDEEESNEDESDDESDD